MNQEQIKEQFDKDIAKHEMTVIGDHGTLRHLRFKRPDSNTMYFDITTWGDHLAISGDMGTYVFWRHDDMFSFFRGDGINPHYWGEKLQAIARNEKYREFSQKKFKAVIKATFDEWHFTDYEEQLACWENIENDIFSRIEDSGWFAIDAAYNFTDAENDPMFLHITSEDLEEYTYHYIWCLYAIVWGIAKYDKTKAGE